MAEKRTYYGTRPHGAKSPWRVRIAEDLDAAIVDSAATGYELITRTVTYGDWEPVVTYEDKENE